jgi:ElaB/YqjD/DUF883 family membrane-anchored ribosome-binding protein
MTDETYGEARDSADTDPEAERIVSEIEETRSGLGATIDEIGHRLQPETIANEAKEKIREATIGKVERFVDDAGQTAQRTSNSLMDTVRQNPVPAALAGIGIGWLFMKMRDSSGSSNGNGSRYGYGSGYGNRSGYGYSSGYGSSGYGNTDPMDKARGAADRVVGGAQDAADQAAQRAQEVGSDIQRAAQQAVEGTQEKVQLAQWQTQYALQDAQRQIDRTWNENPLALGALAVGVGADVALAIPETQKERELMGEQRDQLVQKVSTVASEALDEAKAKTEEVAQQVTEQVGQGDESRENESYN